MQTLHKNDPKSIGPFKLVARLGSGGMGIVYLATRGTESVALKVLNSATLENPLARTRFKKEIQTLRQIDSKFVAKVVDSQVNAENAWLAVEFVNGPDLKALVEDKGPLPFDQWISLAQGLLSGLEAIHAEGVIHRDIKPGNILITEYGPKIIDFGISQDMDSTSLTTTGSFAGSPAWLSPEQIDGAKLTPATDLFSAGSVLHYAASGVSPWGNQNTSATSVVFNNILTKEPDTTTIPEPQKTLIDSLLEKEPELRPSAKKALKLLGQLGANSPAPRITSPETSTISGISKVAKSSNDFNKIVFISVSVLSVFIVLLHPALQISLPFSNQADFVCAETSYTLGDLSGSTFSDLEDTVFSNLLSRDCHPSGLTDPKFSYEHCHARDTSAATSTGEEFKAIDYSEDRTESREVFFYQGNEGRFGCKSYLQLGVMNESESRLGALGFSFESQAPFRSEVGPMSSGETRYSLMFDGNSGTFITRFYSTNDEEQTVALKSPEFTKLEIDRVEFKSGRLMGFSREDRTNELWQLFPNELRAVLGFCYAKEWSDVLLAEGQIPAIEMRQSGNWISAGESSWTDGWCDVGIEATTGDISENTLLSMETNDTCNEVRLDIPEVSNAARDVYEFCLFIKES